ncbi:zona pellucida sperm-binding protein 3-like [Cheilinus undulatus]|uniref:zona pellucida sperm-binding protein 3-like n=1 Tax=Cheilinus undulatus TaxID=241271 RepID=UPI001BD3B524|nr:zona pellucida sperm-binding protein 3-like [Cheilinus undulatus]
METFYLWVNFLIGLLLSEICLRTSLAFPPAYHTQQQQQHAPQTSQSSQHSSEKSLSEEPERVNTIRAVCHPDSLEVIISSDMFGVGAPVNSGDIRLGVEHDGYCTAEASSGDEYRILVGLLDCGTKHWMTEDALIYTNLLIYSPEASPDGLIRMDEAVIPIECHYARKYSLSSSSLTPTWIPYTSTKAAVETLHFDLKIMTDDWLYERSSNVFYLGEPISMEASVRVGHHMGLRVFLSSCVATLEPDIYSEPRYVFIENGCLLDSQLPGSRSHFLPRTQDDKLHLVIDAFRFHEEDRGELYITCHMNAVPVNDAEAPNKACTLINGRWRSADGNDYLCGQCQNQNEVGLIGSSLGKFGPRGFGRPNKPESFWRSGMMSNKALEQEAKVGPMLVLPGSKKSGPIPDEDLPPLLFKISRPALYSSQWRSGVNDRRVDAEKGLLPDEETEDEDEQTSDSEPNKALESGEDWEDEDEDYDGEEGEVAAPLEKINPELSLKSKSAVIITNSTAAPTTTTTTTAAAALSTDVTLQINTTTTRPELSHTHDPKR